jgi:tetratricopeptide (TPR) repeat protein
MKNMIDEQLIQELIEEAYEYLEISDLSSAIKLGKKISKYHSAGYEIMAIGYARKGNTPKAVRYLKKGAQRFTGVWHYWQLMGNYLSDLGRFPDALECYEKALQMEHKDEQNLLLNKAVLLDRMSRSHDALEILNGLSSEFLYTCKMMHVIRIFKELNAMDKCKNAVDKVDWDQVDKSVENGEDYWVSALCFQIADYYLKIGNMDEAKQNAIKSFLVQADNFSLSILRKANQKSTDNGNSYRLTIKADSPYEIEDEPGQYCYYEVFDVVADSKEEALGFVKEVSEPSIRDTVEVKDCEIMETKINDLKGVYGCSGMEIFPI